MGKIAVKKHPKLWAKAVKMAETIYGFEKHSARKMQRATIIYKDLGGQYLGPKDQANSLTVWGEQKWKTSTGKKSGGKLRYLPAKAWKNLSKKEIKKTNAAKLSGYKKGKQYVAQPKAIAQKTRKYRMQGTKKSIKKKKQTKKTQKNVKRKDSLKQVLKKKYRSKKIDKSHK